MVSYLKKIMRSTDVIARLGGDEFALLLPETNQDAAHLACAKLQIGLIEQMRQNKWPVTFSIGVITCSTSAGTPDELVKIADKLMYSVKRSGKNARKFTTFTAENSSEENAP